jgi:hypothetical protein
LNSIRGRPVAQHLSAAGGLGELCGGRGAEDAHQAEALLDVVIEVGSPGNSAAIETAAIKEVVQDQGDRSSIDLVLKVAVKPNETFDAIRARTEKFVADAPVSGRVEYVIGDSQFLGVSEPKKHRQTLITAIADDVKLMQASFGGPSSPVRVNLTGMEQRAQTRPVGPLDLEIYIPYSMSLTSGTGN